jgi:hypothetical protein
MYSASDAFGHDWHASPAGGRLACGRCHPKGRERAALTAKKCADCHRDLLPAGAPYRVAAYNARSYTDALHWLCVGCHRVEGPKRAKADMPRCGWCHKDVAGFVDDPHLSRIPTPDGKHMIIPVVR